MATHRIPILGHSTFPDGSGNCFLQPWVNVATNDLVKDLVWTFKNAGAIAIGLHGRFHIPVNYASTPKFIIHWTSLGTSGNAVWNPAYRAIGGHNTESLDPSSYQESSAGALAAPGAALRKLENAVAFTGSNFAAKDIAQWSLFFEKGNGAHTINADCYLIGLEFEYSDV